MLKHERIKVVQIVSNYLQVIKAITKVRHIRLSPPFQNILVKFCFNQDVHEICMDFETTSKTEEIKVFASKFKFKSFCKTGNWKVEGLTKICSYRKNIKSSLQTSSNLDKI